MKNSSKEESVSPSVDVTSKQFRFKQEQEDYITSAIENLISTLHDCCPDNSTRNALLQSLIERKIDESDMERFISFLTDKKVYAFIDDSSNELTRKEKKSKENSLSGDEKKLKKYLKRIDQAISTLTNKEITPQNTKNYRMARIAILELLVLLKQPEKSTLLPYQYEELKADDEIKDAAISRIRHLVITQIYTDMANWSGVDFIEEEFEKTKRLLKEVSAKNTEHENNIVELKNKLIEEQETIRNLIEEKTKLEQATTNAKNEFEKVAQVLGQVKSTSSSPTHTSSEELHKILQSYVTSNRISEIRNLFNYAFSNGISINLRSLIPSITSPEMLRLILEYGGSFDKETRPRFLPDYLYTPLHYTAATNDRQLFALLLSNTSDQQIVQEALIIAVAQGNESIVEHLLARFELLTLSTIEKALNAIIFSKHQKKSMLIDLFLNNIRIRKILTDDVFLSVFRNCIVESPLNSTDFLENRFVASLDFKNRLSTLFFKQIIEANNPDLLTTFSQIFKGMQPTVINEMSAPHYLIENNKHELLKKYLELFNSGLNFVDNEGRTPLFLAIEKKNIAAIEVLLTFDELQFNKSKQDSHSPLWLALMDKKENKDSKILDLILKYKGKSQKELNSAITLACLKSALTDNLEILQILNENLMPRTLGKFIFSQVVFTAIAHDNVPFIEFFIKNNVDLQITDDFNALDVALMLEQTKIIKLLSTVLKPSFYQITEFSKSLYDSVEIPMNSNQNVKLYFRAALNGDLDSLKTILLENPDIDINIQTELTKNTALMLAAYRGHLNIVEFLISKKAGLNLKNLFEQDEILCANQSGQEKILEYLKKFKNLQVTTESLLKSTLKVPKEASTPTFYRPFIQDRKRWFETIPESGEKRPRTDQGIFKPKQ